MHSCALQGFERLITGDFTARSVPDFGGAVLHMYDAKGKSDS